MKIDRGKVKKSASDVPSDCHRIIQFLKDCSDEDLLKQLRQVNVWYFGKCELFHWIEVLDRFDGILASVAKPFDGKKWVFAYDCLEATLGPSVGAEKKELVFHLLKFTALLIEHSYARHLYNSVEHLISLLDCSDGGIVLSVLNLIYVFSKRSNYLSRLPSEKKKALQEKLTDLAQTWGGREAGCALEQCCAEETPAGAGSVYFEYHAPDDQLSESEPKRKRAGSSRFIIDLKDVQAYGQLPGDIMENILQTRPIPESLQITVYHRIRLAHAMAFRERRLQFVQARLQALSILVYSNAATQMSALVYDGLIEEIVNTLKLPDKSGVLADVKAACLKTLTAIIHLDRNPRLQTIIDCTGATSYHGFLPSLVRQCIQFMTNSDFESYPQQLSTALFSFLYHLASYEAGCESLVASGLIESLLKVVMWPGQDDHITFVTRAVRVIDLITNIDMAGFQTHKGMNTLVGRLQREVMLCRPFHGPMLSPDLPFADDMDTGTIPLHAGGEDVAAEHPGPSSQALLKPEGLAPAGDIEMPDAVTKHGTEVATTGVPDSFLGPGAQCLPQRAALLKSILNFLKKAIPEPAFADNTRSLMDDKLQDALKVIISNAEYYGALLFLLATDVVTVFIFHEPSLLSSLQDSGLTWVVLKALVIKDVPATRENLASLPNTLSALCLNSRGLQAFVRCKPFERLFRILISPEYLPAMKRKRSSDPQGDTAMHLGSAMDELMRHQPTLKTDAMKAIIKLLEELSEMGRDSSLIAFHPTDIVKSSKSLKSDATGASGSEDPASDEEMEDEYRSVLLRKSDQAKAPPTKSLSTNKKYVPVVDYLLNVTKFLDNILSNNGTEDHCVEFVRLGGLPPLLSLLDMPNFPLEFPLMPACQSIGQVCKSIAMLAQDNKVFKESLSQMDALLDTVDRLYVSSNTRGSALLRELANTENPLEALYESSATPLVHAMSATHAYVNIFIFISRGAQPDVRTISVAQWGSDLGRTVLQKLSTLYTRLVWESSVLLTLCTPNTDEAEDLSFAEEDLQKLTAKNVERGEPGVSDPTGKSMTQMTLLKWLLTSSSHLGRALAELFGLFVNQCVGTQPRMRRAPHNYPVVAPCVPARLIAQQLTKLLVQGLAWKCPDEVTTPRLRLTFYICAVGFTTPMLFDNTKNPYQLMLQEFANASGLDALFERFRWVLASFVTDVYVSSTRKTVSAVEFLEGLLDLINKMVNSKSMFETTHSMPVNSTIPGYVPFDTVDFLLKVHRHAFDAMMLLWEHKVLTMRASQVIADRVLSILCHIVTGQKVLLDRYAEKNKSKDGPDPVAGPKAAATSPAAAPQSGSMPFRSQAEVNESYLQQFLDMGFSREHAHSALVSSANNFEVATEYLLTTPAPPPRSCSIGVLGRLEVDMSEEEMMIQAIAMSLGEGQTADPTGQNSKRGEASDARCDKEESKELTADDLSRFSATIDRFGNSLMRGCLRLIDCLPNTVHSVCDLLVAVGNRNGSDWRASVLQQIVADIKERVARLLDVVPTIVDVKIQLDLLCESKEAISFASRLHLFLLLFQDSHNPCALALQERDVLILLVNIVELVVRVLQAAKAARLDVLTPSWLAPLLLVFDLYERSALFCKRRQTQECSHVWKWFDDRSGRWCNYSSNNNSSIDNAYHAGETTVKFTAGRRRYIVLFKTLVQINEDTGNRRPIMLDVIQSQRDKFSESGKEDELKRTGTERLGGLAKATKRKYHELEKQKMEVDRRDDTVTSSSTPLQEISGLDQGQVSSVVQMLTDLLGIPVDPATLNAVMRLCLRLTRSFDIACLFAERGGVEHLLSLKEGSSFSGALPLITLLLRHVVENADTLQHAIERAVVTASGFGVPDMHCGVGQNSVGARELNYLLRALGPVACREPSLFKDSTMKILRLVLPSTRRGQTEESLTPHSPQICKVLDEMKSLGLSGVVPSHAALESLVTLLLNTLVQRHVADVGMGAAVDAAGSSGGKADSKSEQSAAAGKCEANTPHVTLVRRLVGEHIDEDDITNLDSTSRTSSKPDPGDVSSVSFYGRSAGRSEEKKAGPDRPYLSQALLLRLLTELGKSYAAVARFIVEFVYRNTTDQVHPVNIDGPFLAFVFDYLLPGDATSKESSPDKKETKPSTLSALAHTFLAVIGSYWHNADIQSAFILELKGALSRALVMVESKEKHARLQSIFNLITTIIQTSSPMAFATRQVQNIAFIRALIKRGIIADLARCPHSLDLSSPDLVATVNAMLKPLEKLTNLANSQTTHAPAKAAAPAKSETERAAALAESEQPMSAGGADAADAPSNQTEGASDSPAPVSVELQAAEAGPDSMNALRQNFNEIDSIMDELLGPASGDQILSETFVRTQSMPGGEQRIYIEANPIADGIADALDSDSTDEGHDELSDDISDGNDYPEDDAADDHDTTQFEDQIDSQPQGDDTDEDDDDDDGDGDDDDEAEDEREFDGEGASSSQITVDESGTGVIVSIEARAGTDADHDEAENAGQGMEDTFIIDEEENEDEEDDDNEDDEEEEEEEEDDGNDDGSEMDADETIAGGEESINFFGDDDGGDMFEEGDLVATEITFPRQEFQVQLPISEGITDEDFTVSSSSSQSRNTILSHPLLVRASESPAPPSTQQRSARVRGNRTERSLGRQTGHAVNVHDAQGSGSFARVLIGDDLRLLGRNVDPEYANGDVFFDILCEGFESAGILQAVPSALSRWTLESRILDGASVHDCVNNLKPEIVRHLEKLQQDEIQQKSSDDKRKEDEKRRPVLDPAGSVATSAEYTATTSTLTTDSALPGADESGHDGSSAAEHDGQTPDPDELTNAALESGIRTASGPMFSLAQADPRPLPDAVATPLQIGFSRPGLLGSALPSPSRFPTPHFGVPLVPTPSDLRNRPLQQTTPYASSLLAQDPRDTPSNFITPLNPLPELAPNAPFREAAFRLNTAYPTPIAGPTAEQIRQASASYSTQGDALPSGAVSSGDSVVLDRFSDTPLDSRHIASARGSRAMLTRNLGLTPLSSDAGSPSTSFPQGHAFATPAEVLPLHLLRGQIEFSQGTDPRMRAFRSTAPLSTPVTSSNVASPGATSMPSSAHAISRITDLLHEINADYAAISTVQQRLSETVATLAGGLPELRTGGDLTADEGDRERQLAAPPLRHAGGLSSAEGTGATLPALSNVDAANASALASDLAAAIMSQLVTSSPTPVAAVPSESADVSPHEAGSAASSSNGTAYRSMAGGSPDPTGGLISAEASALPDSPGTDFLAVDADVMPDASSLSQTSRSMAAASSHEPGPGPSGVLRAAEEIQRELARFNIPEGVDPSFLAALPDHIREEVLSEQFGIRLPASRIRPPPGSRAVDTSAPAGGAPQEVSPEFLAALPPDVQQEVLEQQRLEQARYVAAQQRPEQPVDPGEFVRNLNPTLRRQVLADMDDSVLAVLPQDLSSEAQNLRRELDQRQLHFHERLGGARGESSMFSQLLRQSAVTHGTPSGGFQFARLIPRGNIRAWRVADRMVPVSSAKKIGRQLLDPEGLSCLLVLLFFNDPALNASRLHRILRNLSYHNWTKQWIIYALISILRRTSSFNQENSSKQPARQVTGKAKLGRKTKPMSSSSESLCDELPPNSVVGPTPADQEQWLTRTLNLAFGGCVNIFQLQRVGRNSFDSFVTVHPQACLDVCKQTLEALSFLAKNFPVSFAPFSSDGKKSAEDCATEKVSDATNAAGLVDKSERGDVVEIESRNDFWDVLVRLNSSGPGRKGKLPTKTYREGRVEQECTSFVSSPLGQLLSMLSHPVIRQNTTLTDKLLRLLAVIAMSLPERPKSLQVQPVTVDHSNDAAVPPDDTVTPVIQHPIHRVTFQDTSVVAPRGHSPVDEVLSGEGTEGDFDHPGRRSEGTVCSETASLTSSLFVEGSPAPAVLPHGLRSPRTESIVSALSDGTVAQSDLSGVTVEQIHADQHMEPMEIDRVSHVSIDQESHASIDQESHASHPMSDTSSADARSSPVVTLSLTPDKEPSILIGQLRMAVNVLISGTCSEEGLEDATTLLLQLSRTDHVTRDCILDLLLEGAREMAFFLQDELKSLLDELKEHNELNSGIRPAESKVSKQAVSVIVNPAAARSQPWRPVRGGRNAGQRGRGAGAGGAGNQLQARRNVPKPVVLDLHLPSMAVLTAKNSNQSRLLRVLKVVLQLRDAARKSAKKPVTSQSRQSRSRGIRLIERLHHGRSSLREVVAALEADMEAMYEMIDRFGGSIAGRPEVARQSVPAISSASAGLPAISSNPSSTSSDASAGAPGSRPADNGRSASGDARSGDGVSGPQAGPSSATQDDENRKPDEPVIPQFPRLSSQLILDDLWIVLGDCLSQLAETADANAVLVLQPAVEAFFLIHGSDQDDDKPKRQPVERQISITSLDFGSVPSPQSPGIPPSPGSRSTSAHTLVDLPADTQKFLRFAETHRTVLNQILRQSTSPLSDGPFAVLVSHTRLLDFDVKRRYFRQELDKIDKGVRREDMAVHIKREHVFEDSYRELHRRSPEEFKNRLYIVFDGEEGQDAGGLLREWYGIMAREMFNPNYALFTVSQGEKATYLPSRNSHCNPNHLQYFKFAGRIVAKAIYDNKLLDCYFTRSFYKHILGKSVHYTDMEAEDYGFYQGLVFLLEHDVDELGYELTFSVEVPVFGANEIHDLKPNGRNIPVTEETKREYVKLVCQEKMTGSIRQQIDSFLEGFYDIIPKRLISIFDEQELELLIAGLPSIDIEDLKANTDYHKYTESSLQVQWFWRALRSFEQADRAKFLQFVTGTSKVPLQGFAALEGMNGPQKFQIHRDDRSTDRLPCAHTCFNQLDLPAYETYDKLHELLLKAINECPEGFGLA